MPTRTPAPLEVEAKLAVPSERQLRQIAALDEIGPYALRRRGRERLHSVYFDTPELILARHGVALRARRSGRRWEITLKWSGRTSGAVHSRPELTATLPSAPSGGTIVLPASHLVQTTALLAGRSLQPILVSDIARGLVDVFPADAPPEAEPLAEIALDRVALRSPQERAAVAVYREVEVELKRGARNDVDHLARLLQRQFELAPSAETKFSHGVKLLYGPQLAELEGPLPDGSVRRSAQRLIGRQLRRLRLHDPGTRLGEDPESLHDMRVASRRLRGILRSFANAFPERTREHLRAELRWLNDLLSPVRDCDVQAQTLQRYESALPKNSRKALEPYRSYISRERERHRTALLAGLGSTRYFRLLLALESFAHDHRPPRLRPARAPAAEDGRRALEHAFERLVRHGEGVGGTPSPEQLHRVRIRAKRLRYLLEALRNSTAKPGRRLLKHLIALQDLLGAHNDAMVAASLLQRYVQSAGKDAKAETLLLLGGFLETELRRARKAREQFHRTWRRFAGKATMSDWKTVRRLLKKEAAAVAARHAGGAARTKEAK